MPTMEVKKLSTVGYGKDVIIQGIVTMNTNFDAITMKNDKNSERQF